MARQTGATIARACQGERGDLMTNTTPNASLALRFFPAVLFAAIAMAGCDDQEDDENKDGGNTSNSAWLVGEDGEMFRLTRDGDVQTYPRQSDADFSAITCMGEATAWVVGEQGTVLVTRDGGEAWAEVAVDAGAPDLTAVATAQAQPEGHETVVAVGTHGAVLRSTDGGAQWTALTGADVVDFSSVTLDEYGELTLATGLDGSIWRSTDGRTMERVFSQSGEVLHGISASHTGERVVAVGNAGLVVLSDDKGTTWAPILAPTTRDLYAVRTAGHGREVVAVGQAGVVVRVDPAGVTAAEHLDPALSLRGLHLRSPGTGQAVGDAGVVLLTDDLGQSWTPLPIGTDVTLRGVDDFHAGGHL